MDTEKPSTFAAVSTLSRCPTSIAGWAIERDNRRFGKVLPKPVSPMTHSDGFLTVRFFWLGQLKILYRVSKLYTPAHSLGF
mgnify:CR=1 FL=1